MYREQLLFIRDQLSGDMRVHNPEAKERENYKNSWKFQYKNSVLIHRKLHFGN